MKRLILCALLSSVASSPTWAGDKVEAAIGGGLGGAAGAVIGDEIGDRKGAIIGSAVGAAIGTAIATQGQDGKDHRAAPNIAPVVVVAPHPGHHCPPGQAKKGRC